MTNAMTDFATSISISNRRVLGYLTALVVMFSWILPGPANAQLTVVYAFPIDHSHYIQGAYPRSNVVEVSPGVFLTTTTSYGGTSMTCPGLGGLAGCGTIVKIDTTVTPPTGTVLHQFVGTDGATPTGQVTLASDGNVYGVTQNGGTNSSCTAQFGCGTVYRIAPDGSGFLTVHNFGGSGAIPQDGQGPAAGIIQGTDGNLYGATDFGGVPQNYGVIFTIAPPFDASAPYNSYSFKTDQSSGVRPQLPVQASDGKLYGLSAGGMKVIYTFDPLAPSPPTAALTTPDFGFYGLIEETPGVFYGVSKAGGTHSLGTLFQATVTPPTATTLYNFAGGTADGASPEGSLYLASDGMLYGTTAGGGSPGCSGCGSIFNLLPGTSGKMSYLHFFLLNEGGYPEAQLIEASDSFLYGTAYGIGGPGTVFKIAKSPLPQWDWQGGTFGLWDGASSVAADPAGNVYVAGVAGTLFDPHGTGSFYIARFTKDGVLDTTFNGSGFVQFGPGLSTDYMARIRVDMSGKNIYVAGYTGGDMFGVTNKGGQDGWLAKFSSKGKFVWGYMFGTPQDDLVLDLALDPSGKPYLSGGTRGNLAGTLSGVQDAFIARVTAKLNPTTHKYDFTLKAGQWGTSGETRRARRLTYCKNVGAPQLYAVGDDNVSGNAWISRFKALAISSRPVQTQTILGGSGPGFFEAHGVGADSSCNIYMGGHNVSQPQPSITDEHFFLDKYDSLLNAQIWEADGPLNSGNTPAPEDFINDLYVDGADRIFVGGSTSSPNIFGNQNSGEFAPWYAAYDGSAPVGGVKKPLRSGTVPFSPGPAVITQGSGIFANSNGIYMVGNTNGNVAGPTDPAFSDAYVYAFVPLP